MADDISLQHEALATSAPRRPLVALIANLLFPPLGHLYVGAARRGFLLWLAMGATVAAAILPLLLHPGRAALLVLLAIAVPAVLALPVDGFLLARRRKSGYRLQHYNRWYAYAATAILGMAASEGMRGLIRTQVQAFRIPTEAMVPTLLPGDFLYAYKMPYRRQGLHSGDVIVFQYPRDPSKDYIKRCIATGGQTIEIRDKKVFVDGRALVEPYVVHIDPTVRSAGYDYRDNYPRRTIPPAELFMMGDNRDNSNDSRFWGTVAMDLVKGKAELIYWSWDAAKSAVRWDRIGRRIE